MTPPLFVKDVKSMKPVCCLSGATLKHMAMICMLADHVNKAILFPLVIKGTAPWLVGLHGVFNVIGRFAFPIYFFLLVEGFYNTRNRWKYLRNLAFFALISEIPFNLFIGMDWRHSGAQNIYFTLALALCVIWATEAVRRRTKYWLLIMVPVVITGCVIAEYGRIDYGSLGVLIPLAFYLFRSKPLAASVAGYLMIAEEVWSLPSFLLTCLYNGQRGRQCKWLNYWFYPMHLLLIGIIRQAVKI